MSAVSGSVVQVYLSWANSVLSEEGLVLENLTEFQNGVLLCRLLDLLHPPAALLEKIQASGDHSPCHVVQTVLEYVGSCGTKLALTAQDIVNGDAKLMLDLLWALILNFTIHSPERSAYQRTVKIGKRLLLDWCQTQLGSSPRLDVHNSMANNLCQNNGQVLYQLVSSQCPVEEQQEADERLASALSAAEQELGISKNLISYKACLDGTVDEHALLIFVALLKRKACVISGNDHLSSSSMSQKWNNSNLSYCSFKETGSMESMHSVTPTPRPVPPQSHEEESYRRIQFLVEQQASSQAAIKALQEQLNSFQALKKETMKSFDVQDASAVDAPLGGSTGKATEGSTVAEESGSAQNSESGYAASVKSSKVDSHTNYSSPQVEEEEATTVSEQSEISTQILTSKEQVVNTADSASSRTDHTLGGSTGGSENGVDSEIGRGPSRQGQGDQSEEDTGQIYTLLRDFEKKTENEKGTDVEGTWSSSENEQAPHDGMENSSDWLSSSAGSLMNTANHVLQRMQQQRDMASAKDAIGDKMNKLLRHSVTTAKRFASESDISDVSFIHGNIGDVSVQHADSTQSLPVGSIGFPAPSGDLLPSMESTPRPAMISRSPSGDELLKLFDIIQLQGRVLQVELDEAKQREQVVMKKIEESGVDKKTNQQMALLNQDIEKLKKEKKEMHREVVSTYKKGHADRKVIKKLQGELQALRETVSKLQLSSLVSPGQMGKIHSNSSNTLKKRGKDIGGEEKDYFGDNDNSEPVRKSSSRKRLSKSLLLQESMESSSTEETGFTSIKDKSQIVSKYMSLNKENSSSESSYSRTSANHSSSLYRTAKESHRRSKTDSPSLEKFLFAKSRSAAVNKDTSRLSLSDLHTSKGHHNQQSLSGLSGLVSHTSGNKQRPTRDSAKARERSTSRISIRELSFENVHDVEESFHHKMSLHSISKQTNIRQLQRSLASATLENEILQSKLNNANRQLSSRVDDMDRLLAESRDNLEMQKTQNEGLLVRLEEEHQKVTSLAARIKALESSLASALEDNTSLNKQLGEALKNLEISLKEPTKAYSDLTRENDRLRESLARKDEDEAYHRKVINNSGVTGDYTSPVERIRREEKVVQEELLQENHLLRETLAAEENKRSTPASSIDHIHARHENENLRRNLIIAEESIKSLQQELRWLKYEQHKSDESRADLETSLHENDSERKLLHTEVNVLREEFDYMNRSVDIITKYCKPALPGTTGKVYDGITGVVKKSETLPEMTGREYDGIADVVKKSVDDDRIKSHQPNREDLGYATSHSSDGLCGPSSASNVTSGQHGYAKSALHRDEEMDAFSNLNATKGYSHHTNFSQLNRDVDNKRVDSALKENNSEFASKGIHGPSHTMSAGGLSTSFQSELVVGHVQENLDRVHSVFSTPASEDTNLKETREGRPIGKPLMASSPTGILQKENSALPRGSSMMGHVQEEESKGFTRDRQAVAGGAQTHIISRQIYPFRTGYLPSYSTPNIQVTAPSGVAQVLHEGSPHEDPEGALNRVDRATTHTLHQEKNREISEVGMSGREQKSSSMTDLKQGFKHTEITSQQLKDLLPRAAVPGLPVTTTSASYSHIVKLNPTELSTEHSIRRKLFDDQPIDPVPGSNGCLTEMGGIARKHAHGGSISSDSVTQLLTDVGSQETFPKGGDARLGSGSGVGGKRNSYEDLVAQARGRDTYENLVAQARGMGDGLEDIENQPVNRQPLTSFTIKLKDMLENSAVHTTTSHSEHEEKTMGVPLEAQYRYMEALRLSILDSVNGSKHEPTTTENCTSAMQGTSNSNSSHQVNDTDITRASEIGNYVLGEKGDLVPVAAKVTSGGTQGSSYVCMNKETGEEVTCGKGGRKEAPRHPQVAAEARETNHGDNLMRGNSEVGVSVREQKSSSMTDLKQAFKLTEITSQQLKDLLPRAAVPGLPVTTSSASYSHRGGSTYQGQSSSPPGRRYGTTGQTDASVPISSSFNTSNGSSNYLHQQHQEQMRLDIVSGGTGAFKSDGQQNLFMSNSGSVLQEHQQQERQQKSLVENEAPEINGEQNLFSASFEATRSGARNFPAEQYGSSTSQRAPPATELLSSGQITDPQRDRAQANTASPQSQRSRERMLSEEDRQYADFLIDKYTRGFPVLPEPIKRFRVEDLTTDSGSEASAWTDQGDFAPLPSDKEER